MMGFGGGLAWGSCVMEWTLPKERDEQGRVLLPGTGKPASRAWARRWSGQFPEAAAVFDEASDVARLRPAEGVLQRADRGAVATEHDPAGAGHGVDRRAAGGRRAHRPDARRRDRPQRRRVRRAAAAGAVDSRPWSGWCASAAWYRRGRGAEAARWPRCSGWPTRRSSGCVPSASDVWPANYNCPGQVVISGRERGSPRSARGSREAGGEGDPAARLGGVPQPADGRRRGSAPARRPGGRVRRAEDAVHVDRDEQARDRGADGRAAGRAGDGAGAVHPGRAVRCSPTACARSSRSGRAACWAGS